MHKLQMYSKVIQLYICMYVVYLRVQFFTFLIFLGQYMSDIAHKTQCPGVVGS